MKRDNVTLQVDDKVINLTEFEKPLQAEALYEQKEGVYFA